MSTEAQTIKTAFVAAQGELTAVEKDRDNPYFRSKYATYKAIVAMLRPVLAKHGLGYVQSVETRDGKSVLVTSVMHAQSGETLESCIPFAAEGTKPQNLGSAITYAKRYGLQCAFGVVVADDDTDDDGTLASGRAAAKATAATEDF